jgi:hypothetical protein
MILRPEAPNCGLDLAGASPELWISTASGIAYGGATVIDYEVRFSILTGSAYSGL